MKLGLVSKPLCRPIHYQQRGMSIFKPESTEKTDIQ